MEAIKASPESLKDIFQNKRYEVPEYQRPYTWDVYKCGVLWDDLTESFISDKENEYFLGTIVLIKNTENNKWIVIDGQQRLTSLILLMKALSEHHQYKLLNRCMGVYDPKSDEIMKGELRLESLVLDTDKDALLQILENSQDKQGNKFEANYEHFNEKIQNWKHENPEKIEEFIDYFLNNVKLLPIDCGDEDGALKIFETLNDRGTPLSEADIFKSKIYRNLDTQKEKDEFIEYWKSLGNNHLWYFRVYMHICRAQSGDTGNEINLRKYFDKLLSDKSKVVQVISDIQKIQMAVDYHNGEINHWWTKCIDLYPSDAIITYPYYVYMYKYGQVKNGELVLSKTRELELINLIKDLIRFIYIKGIIYKTRNAIKFDLFKMCASIWKEDKHQNISPLPTLEEKNRVRQELEFLRSNSRYTKGILGLFHALNPKQMQNGDLEFSLFDIEHILPRVWHHYDGWDQETYNEKINSLGNLTLFEKKKNIAARNEYLQRKQEYYKDSAIVDVKNLTKLKQWTPDDLNKRNTEIISRVTKFLFEASSGKG